MINNKENLIELSLNDSELFEIYSFVKAIVVNNKDLTVPLVSMAHKLSNSIDKIASTEMKAEVSMCIQAAMNSIEKNIIASQNFENGIQDLAEGMKEERKKIDEDIDNLMK